MCAVWLIKEIKYLNRNDLSLMYMIYCSKKKKNLFDMITNGENPEPSRFLSLGPHKPILVLQGPWNMFQQSMQMQSTLASTVCPSD